MRTIDIPKTKLTKEELSTIKEGDLLITEYGYFIADGQLDAFSTDLEMDFEKEHQIFVKMPNNTKRLIETDKIHGIIPCYDKDGKGTKNINGLIIDRDNIMNSIDYDGRTFAHHLENCMLMQQDIDEYKDDVEYAKEGMGRFIHSLDWQYNTLHDYKPQALMDAYERGVIDAIWCTPPISMVRNIAEKFCKLKNIEYDPTDAETIVEGFKKGMMK
jgi:hypothetical protein